MLWFKWYRNLPASEELQVEKASSAAWRRSEPQVQWLTASNIATMFASGTSAMMLSPGWKK